MINDARKRGRKKGTPKTGGRQKGTPNKRTQLGEDKLKTLVEVLECPERMAEELQQLHGKDYFRVYFDALQYLRPRYSSIEFKGDVAIGNEVADKLRTAIGNQGKRKLQ